MSKTGKCSFCSQNVSIPKSQCFFECRFCNSKSLFLCHIIPQPKDPMHIRCKQCKIMYSLYNCPKCEAFAVVKDFKSGKMYNCLCGFQATMLSCNQCTALLCLPNRKNYQLTNIQCKKCSNTFKYRLCPTCGQCNYLNSNQNSNDVPLCFNDSCPQSRKQYAKIQQQQPPFPKQQQKVEQTYPQINPYEIPPPPQKKESDLCSICLNKQKCMINTTCYHLSICQPCSLDLNGRCPICRTVGTYKKIYRS